MNHVIFWDNSFASVISFDGLANGKYTFFLNMFSATVMVVRNIKEMFEYMFQHKQFLVIILRARIQFEYYLELKRIFFYLPSKFTECTVNF